MAKQHQNKLAEAIQPYLNERHMSIRKLAQAAEIDPATLSRIMNGKRKPTMDHLYKIALCLDIPPADLLKSAGYPLYGEDEDDAVEPSAEKVRQMLAAINLPPSDFTRQQVDDHLIKFKHYSRTEEGHQTILQQFSAKVTSAGSGGPYVEQLKEWYTRYKAQKSSTKELAIMGSALLYFIITLDVIPDYLMPVGYLDDAFVVQLMAKSLP
ncbi:transcriptional regulator [Lentibacillus kapialis]|uniref:Transcriptional regulator n=1 Tax=Lentibacillus kapialis TaxID=340214 RepID=A0A917PK61_9BACI|nr:helix-turn-helix domain-containing protein [Lentibacillus kapialis]GGJ81954.1 transcriptional regulator [Lentibacillus kapialis]